MNDSAFESERLARQNVEGAGGDDGFHYRLTIRFTNGETMLYTVREPLHAQDISSDVRFVVVSSYLCETPERCDEILLLNLNEVSYVRTKDISLAELAREEELRREGQSQEPGGVPRRLARIGFI